MANAIQKRQEANEDFKMHEKIKVLRKTQKKVEQPGFEPRFSHWQAQILVLHLSLIHI